ADLRVLFVGNSHTLGHDLPDLVGRMTHALRPDRTVYTHAVGLPFLDAAADDPTARDEVDARPWTHVVLQAQRISASGKREYSRAEGIDLARRAKDRGAAVFFSEWGLKDDPTNGPRHERVYGEMAKEAGVRVAAVGRAWDLARAARPDLPLYEGDGNHQTATGAFLTAAVLAGRLTETSPAPLADFAYPEADADTRKLLADAAARAAEREMGD
ncbi:MAG: hypothetical protein K2X87_34350, partial [Gemmataceae bacterium]|nr:hypothetical protein [Gemmataceae bacterium]